MQKWYRMSELNVLGIDPGNKGALCLLRSFSDKAPEIHFMDAGKDVWVIQDWLLEAVTVPIRMAMIEDVHSLGTMSAKSNFSFGGNVAKLDTLLQLQRNHFGLDKVQPKLWQKTVGISVPAQFKGTERAKRLKQATAEQCTRLYPNCEIHGPKGGLMDGRSDALMIAHYCMLKYKL